MGFTPRLSRPEAGNKYYITKKRGGYSDAIEGSPRDSACDVLSNCVGYAYGRFNEIGDWGSCRYLCPTWAENFMSYTGGLETGQEPRVGACMVWQKGATLSNADGAGHVAIVEKVYSATSILTSESGWGCANPFWTKTRSKGDGNWGAGAGYKFLGFIYNPAPCCGGDEKTQEGTACDYMGTVTTGLNVRQGPGLEYRITGGLQKNQEVRIVRETGKWGQLENGGWCCLDYIRKGQETSSKGQEAGGNSQESGDWEPKVGDLVEYAGGAQYVNAYAVAGVAGKPGKARVTAVFPRGKHTVHIVHTDGGNVYGWVDRETIKKI